MRLLLLLLAWLCVLPSLRGQSIYEIEWRQPAPGRKKALLVTDQRGSGFIRVAWYHAGRKENVLTDLDILPGYPVTLTGDTTGKKAGTRRTLMRCDAVPVRNLSGIAEFPARQTTFWLLDEGAGFHPVVDDVSRFATKDMMPGFLTNADPTPFLDFSKSTGLAVNRAIPVAQLAPSLLREYFTAAELTGPSPLSVAQLTAAREKNTATLFCITATDLTDVKIRKTTTIDKENILRFFGRATAAINMQLKAIPVEGASFTLAGLDSVLRSLRVGPDDVVVFAYSGHGFSFSNDPTSIYPQLALWQGKRNARFFQTQGVNLETVFNRIQEKGARLNIVIGDCCNWDAGVIRHIMIPDGTVIPPPPPPPVLRRQYFRLLMEARGSFIACAAAKGELAAGDSRDGGFFTKALINTLDNKMMSPQDVDPQLVWTDVFEETRTRSRMAASRIICRELKGPCRQNLVYRKVIVR